MRWQICRVGVYEYQQLNCYAMLRWRNTGSYRQLTQKHDCLFVPCVVCYGHAIEMLVHTAASSQFTCAHTHSHSHTHAHSHTRALTHTYIHTHTYSLVLHKYSALLVKLRLMWFVANCNRVALYYWRAFLTEMRSYLSVVLACLCQGVFVDIPCPNHPGKHGLIICTLVVLLQRIHSLYYYSCTYRCLFNGVAWPCFFLYDLFNI